MIAAENWIEKLKSIFMGFFWDCFGSVLGCRIWKVLCCNCFVCLNKVIGINIAKNAKMLTSAKLIFWITFDWLNFRCWNFPQSRTSWICTFRIKFFLKFCWRQHIFAKMCFLLISADVSKISKKFLIRNVHIHDVLLCGKFQHLKLSQSKVIQKISFADVSIFAFFAIFIPITLFRQTKQLSHSTFHILQSNTLLKRYKWTSPGECYWWLKITENLDMP